MFGSFSESETECKIQLKITTERCIIPIWTKHLTFTFRFASISESETEVQNFNQFLACSKFGLVQPQLV